MTDRRRLEEYQVALEDERQAWAALNAPDLSDADRLQLLAAWQNSADRITAFNDKLKRSDPVRY